MMSSGTREPENRTDEKMVHELVQPSVILDRVHERVLTGETGRCTNQALTYIRYEWRKT